VGEAGLLVNPTDTAAWVAALRRVLSDAELRVDLKQRGLLQAQKFSWARAVAELKQIYHTLSQNKR
jgi:glycosyltransferase involved in cell wall biosynthesis